jgi:large subunit ribosomal protein L5
MFLEIDQDKIDRVRGMDITFVTSATNDEEGRALLKHLGFPFKAVDDPKKQKAKRGPAFYAKKKK